MSERTYWLDLFTGTTWQEFLDAGGEITGFRDHRWRTLQRMRPGDYLLAYLTGISRWIGVLEVVGEAFKDDSPIWTGEHFPSRIRVRVIAALTPSTAVPVTDMWNELSVFQNLKDDKRWSGSFRGSPAKWKKEDGETVVRAVLQAQDNPINRPFDEAKLARRPAAFEAKEIPGEVTIPETEPDHVAELRMNEDQETVREATPHTEIQWLLLKLGGDLGMDVWVARNDRNRIFNGHRFAAVPRLRRELPHQFDEATNRTIELIDVLWLQGNAIVGAFEIESTTSIYSGLLRMGDLIAMQPNLNIPLYLVAPDERREKVMEEVNRPTFSRLTPPLAETCKYIAFSSLRSRVVEVSPFVRYLKPDFVEELAETCEV